MIARGPIARFLPRLAASRLFRDIRGAAVVEFGLALPVFMVFVIGLFEFSRVMWTDNALQLAVDQAARYAIAHPTASPSQISDYANSQLKSVDTTQVTLTVEHETTAGIDFVTVTATMPYDSMTRLIPIGTITLTGRSRVPLTG